MKRNIFLLTLLMIIAVGCSLKNEQGIGNDKPAINSNNLNTYNENEVMSKIDDLKNGAKPAEPAKKTTPAEDSAAASQTTSTQLENLAAVYKQAIIKTNLGDITVAFYPDVSPITVNNFMNLAKKEFYNGTKFHRVIKDFMIQGGDPLSKDDDPTNDGTGGPGYRFQDEFNDHKLVRGSLAMANSGPNTNGSQFFIVTAASTPWLDGKHTNFGYVVSGLDIVDKIENLKVNERDYPLTDAVINSIELVK